MSEDQFLEGYVKKLMEREMDLDDPEPLTDEQLKQIALDTGMSEQEWLNIKQEAIDTENRGFDYLDRGNYEDALLCFKESISLYPNSPEAFYGYAKAHFKKGVELENESDFDTALLYIKRTLKLDPGYQYALDLKSNIRKYKRIEDNKVISKGSVNKYKKYLFIGLPILILLFWIISSYNSANDLGTTVDSKWSEVENVHKRRSDLLPQLTKVVKKAAAHEKEVISEALKARDYANASHIEPSKLNDENIQSFIKSQQKVNQSMSNLLAVAEQYPKSEAMGNFRSLQDQIEGSQNRITVANKYFNEAVAKYNKKVNSFPMVLLGFDSKPYIKVSSSDMEIPDIDL